jgi:hypothetical protein
MITAATAAARASETAAVSRIRAKPRRANARRPAFEGLKIIPISRDQKAIKATNSAI